MGVVMGMAVVTQPRPSSVVMAVGMVLVSVNMR